MGALVCLAVIIFLGLKSIYRIDRWPLGIQAKVILVYSLSSIIRVLSFLFGCLRFGVFPTKKMFRL
jgi:hypothetical protein